MPTQILVLEDIIQLARTYIPQPKNNHWPDNLLSAAARLALHEYETTADNSKRNKITRKQMTRIALLTAHHACRLRATLQLAEDPTAATGAINALTTAAHHYKILSDLPKE